MSLVVDTHLVTSKRDSKDSCYFEEMMSESGLTDLSATQIDDNNRLSPQALTVSPASRKNSFGDVDSGFSNSDGELSRENSFRTKQAGTVGVTSGHSTSTSADPTTLLLEKIMMMEQRLVSMETELKNETEQRQALAKKVTKLEEENELLLQGRTKAVSQLQSFSEKFFAMQDIKNVSPISTPTSGTPLLRSPRNSHINLRRVGSNSSMGSFCSRASNKSLRSRDSSARLSQISV